MQYEPLATYLEPRFGNIYQRNGETWTPELEAAVTGYLLAVPADDYAAFVKELAYKVPDGSRAAQAAFIIGHSRPWQVAYAFHIAAVKAVPTFQQLMAALSAVWDDYEDWKSDARYWLDARATDEQLREVARHLGASVSVLGQQEADIRYEDLADYLTDTVKPETLLHAWKQAMPSEPTDLTDQEWALLEPLIPNRANTSPPNIVRWAINGMLWRQAHPVFAPTPVRYGRGTLINARRNNYRKAGIFARMLANLEDKPEAARLVKWLKALTGHDYLVKR